MFSAKKIILVFIQSLCLVSCGENIFSPLAKDKAEQATVLLEKGKAKEASKIMLEALGSTYKDHYNQLDSDQESAAKALADEINKQIDSEGKSEAANYASILASCHLILAELDTLDIMIDFITSKAAESGDQSITGLFDLLPEATTENSTHILKALVILQSIGKQRWTAGDSLKYSLVQASYASILSKSLDLDGDGKIPKEEAEKLTPEKADTIYQALINGEKTLAGSEEGSTDAKTLATINSYKEGIDAASGDTTLEKMKNYLAAEDSS